MSDKANAIKSNPIKNGSEEAEEIIELSDTEDYSSATKLVQVVMQPAAHSDASEERALLSGGVQLQGTLQSYDEACPFISKNKVDLQERPLPTAPEIPAPRPDEPGATATGRKRKAEEEPALVAGVGGAAANHSRPMVVLTRLPTTVHACQSCGMMFLVPEYREAHAGFCASPAASLAPAAWGEERTLLLLACMAIHYRAYSSARLLITKQKHWARISRVVGTTATSARRQWNSLVVRYKRELSEMEDSTRPVGERWGFHKQLDNIINMKLPRRPDFVLAYPSINREKKPVQITIIKKDVSEGGTNESERANESKLQPQLKEVAPMAETGKIDKLIALMAKRYSPKMSQTRTRKVLGEVGAKLGIKPKDAVNIWNTLVSSYNKWKMTYSKGDPAKPPWEYYCQMEAILDRDAGRLSETPAQQTSSTSSTRAAAAVSAAVHKHTVIAPAVNVPAQQQPSIVLRLGPGGVLQQVLPASVSTSSAAGGPAAAVGGSGASAAATAAVNHSTTTSASQPTHKDTVSTARSAQLLPPPISLQVLQTKPVRSAASADLKSFSNQRKALFTEKYLQTKGRREDMRLELEERRIRALEKIADAITGGQSGSSRGSGSDARKSQLVSGRI